MNLKSKLLAGTRVLRANFLGQKIPLAVSFRITHRCNLNCVYCHTHKIAKNMYEMTTEQVKHLIDELKSLGTQTLSFTGGEPLVRKDIGEIIDYAHNKGITTYLGTNAQLLASKVNEIRNVSTLLISLDGREELNDSYRGQGSFQSVLEGLEAVKKLKAETKNDKLKVWLTMVITDESKNHIDFIIDLAEKNNCLATFGILMNTPTTRDESQTLALSEQTVKEVYRHLSEQKKAGKPIVYSQAMLDFFYKTGGIVDYSTLPFHCWAGRLFCVINSNGDVYPCAGLVNVYEPKNCLELGFKKAFETMPPIPNNCKGCTYTGSVQKNLLFSLNWNSLMYILKEF